MSASARSWRSLGARLRRVAGRAALAMAAAALVLLAAAWAADRSRRWEQPRWSAERFVALELRNRSARSSTRLSVVPVNLHCPHCVASLASVARDPACGDTCSAVVALIVDSPAPPGRAAVARLPGEEIWWDRRGIWRGRWGHRIYGEVIHFDASGRYLFTQASRSTVSQGE